MSNTKTHVSLTFEQAVADFTQVLEERGADYVYVGADDGCVYYELKYDHNGFVGASPSCAVGCILDVEGLDPLRVVDYGLNEDEGVVGLINRGVVVPADWKTRIFLEVVQERQDKERPYGEVLVDAVRAAQHMSDPDLPQQGRGRVVASDGQVQS